MDTKLSKKYKFKRVFANILSIVAILAIALANIGFTAQAAPRSLPSDWDGSAVRKASILLESDGFKMWYDGIDFQGQTQVGLATSTDGTSWTKYFDNPVLSGDPDAWDSSGEHAPFVMKDGDQYKMWYEGSDGNVRQLGYATSDDGITWTKYEGNPVLQNGDGYDQDVAGHGSVLYEDGNYKLWYHAIGSDGIIIAYATSPDGINWVKFGPVLQQEEGLWDEYGLWGPSVLKVGETYWMWYSASGQSYPASIGAATSENGENWTRVSDAPIITIADNNIGDPHVIFDEEIFKMWFTNFSDGAIYYAESSDGIDWNEPTPVLPPGVLFPLEGWHDGNEGEVEVNSCTAFGWSADPDDRDRDVQIRILADGNEVATTTASDYGEDMDELGICPGGTCRFTVNLWGLISLGEEHQITVQAYDLDTDDWWNLEGTPKTLTCPNPFIAVSLTEHWFWVNNFTPETLVTFSIYDYQGAENLILEFSKPTDEMGNLTIEGWQHIWDPEPGDYIVATDGLITKDLVLEYVTLEVFDPENDLVSGHAIPDREVGVGVGNEAGEQWMNVIADHVTGEWIAQFEFNTGEDYLTEDSWAGGHVADEDGDVTAAHNSGPPEPPAWFTVFPEWDAIEGWNFPLGAEVHLAIYEDPDASPVYEQYEPVTFTPWGSWELWVWFDLAGGDGYDVKAGDIVKLSYGDTVRTHTVQNLAISKVNPEDDLVKGTADPGAEINVWPHATGQEEFVNANPMGKWNVDFTGIYDLMPGDGGRARIWENGNATEVEWYIPRSRIVASITEDWFYLQEFSPNKTIKFTVFEAQGEKPIWKGETTTDDSGFAWINAEDRWNLEPGNYLVVKDGRNSKDLIIEGFTFDVFSITNGQLFGTAPEPYGRNVWVGIGWENDGWSMDVTTDGAGSWLADFGNPVPTDYQWVAAQIFDDDGDASELRPSVVIDWSLVIANQEDWVDSEIFVDEGQSFTIEALGLMNPCADTYPNGPDFCIFYTPLGDGAVPDENELGPFPGPGLSFMALLGRIYDENDDGAPFYIGAGGTFTAEKSGTLQFTPNDNLRTDNQGSYIVSVMFLEP